jgi:uncharacterized membrane protein
LAYRDRILKDIARWESGGIVDAGTAIKLREDVAVNSAGGFSLPRVLGMLAALLIAGALVTFIASNWQEIPRLARFALILAVLWAGFGGGAWRLSKGDQVTGQGLLLLGGIGFGAGIALTGQMYHIAGDELVAAIIWLIAVLAGALTFRSGPLAALASVLVFVTLVAEPMWGQTLLPQILLAPVFWLAAWTAAIGARALIAPHLLVLGVPVWIARLVELTDIEHGTGIAVAAAGLAAYCIATRLPAVAARLGRFASALPGYGVAFLGAGLLLEAVIEGGSGLDHALWPLMALIISIVALLDRGRTNRGVRWVSYVLFAVSLVWLGNNVLGSLLGTSGLLLSVGLGVTLLAVVATRMERSAGAAAKAGAGQ